MTVPARIGLIGCGNISTIYLRNAALFRDIEFVACADLRPEAAAAQAAEFGIAARGLPELLASDDVDIVLNLTIPAVHAEVSEAALSAGKHVYSEKPLATRLEDGVRLLELARRSGKRVGAAPDTVLGPGYQTARRMIDEGAIGRPLLGVATFLSHGMEHWHPTPEFFFKPGAGPVLDMGPYYVSAMVTLLGPVAAVQSAAQMGFPERIVTTEGSPVRGQAIRVETPTTVQALLEFESGAQVSFLTSWDVWRHGMLPLELHGSLGSMRLPDPNWFGGVVSIARERDDWADTDTEGEILGGLSYPTDAPKHANYRGLGLAEMARAIAEDRPHRASGDVALHVLAVMTAMLDAAAAGSRIVIEQGCARPQALGSAETASLLA